MRLLWSKKAVLNQKQVGTGFRFSASQQINTIYTGRFHSAVNEKLCFKKELWAGCRQKGPE